MDNPDANKLLTIALELFQGEYVTFASPPPQKKGQSLQMEDIITSGCRHPINGL